MRLSVRLGVQISLSPGFSGIGSSALNVLISRTLFQLVNPISRLANSRDNKLLNSKENAVQDYGL